MPMPAGTTKSAEIARKWKFMMIGASIAINVVDVIVVLVGLHL